MTGIPPSAPARRALLVAAAFLAGPWEPEAMAARAHDALPDRSPGYWTLLASRACATFVVPPLAVPDTVVDLGELASWIQRDPTIGPPATWRALEPRWPVPTIATRGELAEAMGLAPTHLEWFGDVASFERHVRDEPLRHYSYRWLPKRAGGTRLLEAPKPMLRFFQRRILHEILDRIPAHEAAHGFLRGRSVHSFVAPHVGQPILARLDLEAFFPSVRPGRVHGLLRAAGYPDPVAHCLTGLMTNAVPREVLDGRPITPRDTRERHRREAQLLTHPHLPQGAPTSPALANLVAFRLDRRLTGLARSFGAQYTRYADDLALSGRLGASAAERLVAAVDEIVRDEGFSLHPTKQRVTTDARRQVLTGLVVNDRPNVDRATYDRLRAILHDAATNGPDHANREDHPRFREHLLGRIGWIEQANPGRGPRLRALFDQIPWEADALR